jgi:lipopolysaccharide export system protein LptA
VIAGEVVRYYMRENRSEVSGGKGKVEAVFSTSARPTREGKP